MTAIWNKLRWPFKALIIAAPIILLGYFAMENGWMSDKGQGVAQTPATTQAGTADAAGQPEAKPAASGRTFAYQPARPVDGQLKGVVEVGATGFNSFVVNMDAQRRWEIVSKDFGQSLAYEGMATTEDIRSGLKRYISSMFEKGVKSRDVHFVISSGAQKNPKTQAISDELRKMGFVVNLVTPEQEGQLALRAALPADYQGSAFVADIGSGNTKVSWMSQGGGVTSVEAPGSKYFEKDLPDGAVYSEVKDKASRVPAGNRSVCFIIGGTPYELAKQGRNGDERYTVLADPASYAADKPKTKAGLNIYKALKDATGCDTFVFDWDANFTIGFLLQLKQ